ncbi:hypothetical protein BC567DRAFT_57646 [Phyllosticta citribraziliensis]
MLSSSSSHSREGSGVANINRWREMALAEEQQWNKAGSPLAEPSGCLFKRRKHRERRGRLGMGERASNDLLMGRAASAGEHVGAQTFDCQSFTLASTGRWRRRAQESSLWGRNGRFVKAVSPHHLAKALRVDEVMPLLVHWRMSLGTQVRMGVEQEMAASIVLVKMFLCCEMRRERAWPRLAQLRLDRLGLARGPRTTPFDGLTFVNFLNTLLQQLAALGEEVVLLGQGVHVVGNDGLADVAHVVCRLLQPLQCIHRYDHQDHRHPERRSLGVDLQTTDKAGIH